MTLDLNSYRQIGFEQQIRIKRARMDKTSTLQTNLESDQEFMESTLSTAHENVDALGSTVLTHVRVDERVFEIFY